jgi:protein-L-isoaspartate(D-aspartate) O-methyltransferase
MAPFLLFLWAGILLPVFLLFGAGIEPALGRQKSSTGIERRGETLSNDLEWSRPRFFEREQERKRMVETALLREGITDAATLEAMRNVPRHRFVPEAQRSKAYLNIPLPIGMGQTISQPFIVGYMTQMLHLSPGARVLEIGTGSGYQAAVLAEITPEVYTIEIIRELGRKAHSRLQELGYHTIRTKLGDGYYGWEEHAPFDAVIVTAAAGHLPPPLVKQLKPGGRIVIPLGSPYHTQTLMEVIKTEDGNIQTERKLPVRFVPMTGAALE